MQTTESVAETHVRHATHSHWVRLKRLTFGLLLLWVMVTFVAIYFSRDLSFSFLGWPFNYWMVAQGSLLVYLVITMVYAWFAGRLDRRYDVDEVTRE
jgi:putative solute:sodium symporter small subunit